MGLDELVQTRNSRPFSKILFFPRMEMLQSIFHFHGQPSHLPLVSSYLMDPIPYFFCNFFYFFFIIFLF